jgi:hypothetical protein
MNHLTSLLKLLSELHPHEVQYGCGGLKLFEAEELEEAQIGYSVGANGESFCRSHKGSWAPGWFVIGHDTGVGDPIFIDSEIPELPVFTAMHGEGFWDPKPVAVSLNAFAQCWIEFARLAQERESPVEQKSTSLSESQRASYLNRIREINKSQIEAELWNVLLAYGEDGGR